MTIKTNPFMSNDGRVSRQALETFKAQDKTLGPIVSEVATQLEQQRGEVVARDLFEGVLKSPKLSTLNAVDKNRLELYGSVLGNVGKGLAALGLDARNLEAVKGRINQLQNEQSVLETSMRSMGDPREYGRSGVEEFTRDALDHRNNAAELNALIAVRDGFTVPPTPQTAVQKLEERAAKLEARLAELEGSKRDMGDPREYGFAGVKEFNEYVGEHADIKKELASVRTEIGVQTFTDRIDALKERKFSLESRLHAIGDARDNGQMDTFQATMAELTSVRAEINSVVLAKQIFERNA